MTKLSKSNFYVFFILILLGIFVYIIYSQRNSVCDSYNRNLDLRIKSYVKSTHSKDDLNTMKHFVEIEKKQFSKKVDNLIAFSLSLFYLLILLFQEIIKRRKTQTSLEE